MCEEIAAYSIGSLVWFRGMEYRVINEPYMLHGAEWQDARYIHSGKIVTIPTPAQTKRHVTASRAEYAESQEGFKRLHEDTVKALTIKPFSAEFMRGDTR